MYFGGESWHHWSTTLGDTSPSYASAITIFILSVTTALLSYINIEFTRPSPTSQNLTCDNKRLYLVNPQTLDIKCDVTKEIQRVIISVSGVKSMCSLYINGGRNVGLKQFTWQSSNWTKDWISSVAVDGCTYSNITQNSCSHTNNDTSPTWSVRFNASEITRYIIYNRNENKNRLKHFILQGSGFGSNNFTYQDETDIDENVYTVLDISKTIVSNVTIIATFKDGNAKYLTLCEVEIYGECPAGRWELDCQPCRQSCSNNCHLDDGSCNEVCIGSMDPPHCITGCDNGGFGLNCAQKCPGHCLDKKCDGFNGKCVACEAGFTGATCNISCHVGRWGLNCNRTCSSNCKYPACNITDGQCIGGCIAGYAAPMCTQGCVSGTWGESCRENCSTNCQDSKCNNINGFCSSGCIAGYQPPACNTSCTDGRWGISCAWNCSSNCRNTPCNNVNGHCPDGCIAGYMLPNCTKECDAHHWGENCQNNCSRNCYTEMCDRFNGTCHSGCKAGYQLPDCSQDCSNGTWGLDCTKNCSSNCKSSTCNKANGQCLDGCQAGYTSLNCTLECDAHQWGEDCQNNCSRNCQTEKCDRFNGTCDSGCKAGYRLLNCTKECEPTKFGENCAEKCSTNCTDQLCHHVNGRCHKCQPGHRGKLCDQFCENKTYGQDCMTNCSTNCTDQSCRPVNGSCISCHPGYLGDVCDKVCDAGFYGQNCLSNCSLFCNTSSECEPQTGTCYDGCKDGYSGDDCKNKCQDRTYGRNCTKLCSAQCKTKSSVTCHHVSGECLTECEEDYSGQYCENKESSVASSKVGAIVGSIVAIIILAVLATVGAIIWKRKLQRKPQDKNEEVMHLDNIRERAEQETAGDSTYINVAGILINTKIAVEVLNKYIDSHTGDFFTEQYKKVPKPKNVSTEVAVSDENKNKNRYKNICPYDHSRVHLKINTNKSEGDYINASYVRDSHNDVKFIAAQGPFGAVVNDFVRMLWEQKVEKVVMLTNLIEEGKPKCDKYWPDSGNTAFGEITVKLKDTQILADYVIRKIELEKSDAPTQILTHYHFTSWPDQGVPVTPWALVDFEQRVDINSSTAPVIVHCSAGVGRTGTFIALHNVLSQAKETGSVDFYKTLVKLREDRFLMIQTPDQYIFLHKAAQAAIVSMGTTVIFNDSKTRMQHLLTKSISGMSNMEKEFQNICAICQNESNPKTNSEAIYQNTENVKVVDTKNRFESIIPKNCYRPYLGSDSKEFDDYINAVFVQGFYKKDQQILTQLPMPSTLIDFFRLVTQHRVSLIVAFEVDKRSTDQTIANYLPSQDKPITASPFSIRSMGIKGDNMWEEHTIKVINENTKAEHDVIHWKCKVLDPDARRLLSLVNKSRSYNAHANGRIIYTCRDGATYSGLACVLSLLLDRIDHDTCLAIPLVVGSVKSIRPQVISTFEHYVMLHEALQSYNDTTAAYTNMEENFFPRFSSLKNKDLDESQAKEGNVYSNM